MENRKWIPLKPTGRVDNSMYELSKLTCRVRRHWGYHDVDGRVVWDSYWKRLKQEPIPNVHPDADPIWILAALIRASKKLRYEVFMGEEWDDSWE